MLRRLKEHVEDSLTAKEEIIVEVELTTLQKQVEGKQCRCTQVLLCPGCLAALLPCLSCCVAALLPISLHLLVSLYLSILVCVL